MASLPSRALTTLFLVLAGVATRAHGQAEPMPTPEDLRRINYNGTQGMWCRGINIASFDLSPQDGRTGYSIPSFEMLQYLHDQGSNCFRMPITWERLQSSLGDDFLSLVGGYQTTVNFITETLGDTVIIDPHDNDNGLRHAGVDATRAQFVSLWKAIAALWGGNPRIIFGLYNEPRYGYENGQNGYFDPDATDQNGTMIQFWREWMQEAIDQIRVLSAGNLILVPGLHWTGCADWSGEWWGEYLDNMSNTGNTRLAALTDPYNNIAYDIHQYMDGKYTGEELGCTGHDSNFWCVEANGEESCSGADAGLELTIAWAQRYNKKMMMTEIGSYPGVNEAACESKLRAFLQRMQDSGVFIGYQVWQAGCESCLADQWSGRPGNLDWYRLDDPEFRVCAPTGSECGFSGCCQEEGHSCWVKDEHWATCQETCTQGWTCNMIVNRTEMPYTTTTTRTTSATTSTFTGDLTNSSTTITTARTSCDPDRLQFSMMVYGVNWLFLKLRAAMIGHFMSAVTDDIVRSFTNRSIGIRSDALKVLMSPGPSSGGNQPVLIDVAVAIASDLDQATLATAVASESYKGSLEHDVPGSIAAIRNIGDVRYGEISCAFANYVDCAKPTFVPPVAPEDVDGATRSSSLTRAFALALTFLALATASGAGRSA